MSFMVDVKSILSKSLKRLNLDVTVIMPESYELNISKKHVSMSDHKRSGGERERVHVQI